MNHELSLLRFFASQEEFDVPYDELEKTVERLHEQGFVKIENWDGMKVYVITDEGKKRIQN